MSKMKNAFIFDFDGTLGETIPCVVDTVTKSFHDLGLPATSPSEIRSHFGPDELGLLRSLDFKNSDALYKHYLRNYKDMHSEYSSAPFSGIEDVLGLLSENKIPTAIVTGKGRDSAEISLAQYGIADYFSAVECGSSAGVVKPQKMRRVLDIWKTDVKSTQVFYVGDAVQDVYDSLEVGAIPISVAWSSVADAEELRKTPTSRIFERVDDFQKWIVDSVL